MHVQPIWPVATGASLAYLAARGCTPEMAAALGVEHLTHAQAYVRLGYERGPNRRDAALEALWLPVYGPTGVAHPLHGQAIFFGADGACTAKLHTKTSDEHPNEVSHLPTGPLRPGMTVYWCESVLKAAVLRYHLGLNAIGMNGVDGWQRSKRGLVNSVRTLPSGCRHVLVTDSLNIAKAAAYRSVVDARRRWLKAIKRDLQAESVSYVDLPAPPDGWPKGDWGIDDLFMHPEMGGVDAVRKVLHECTRNQAADMAGQVAEFNRDCAYIRETGTVYDRVNKQMLSVPHFHNNNAPCRVEGKAVSVAWFQHPDRFEVQGLAFRPGAGEITQDGRLNLWRGFSVDPMGADAYEGGGVADEVQRYWVDTIYDAFGPDGRHLIEIFALLVQDPGRRISRHVFMGGKDGTGKSFICKPLEMILADHYEPWTVASLLNHFNSAMATCRLGVLREAGDPAHLPPKTRIELGELIKGIADSTVDRMQIEQKGRDVFKVECNQLFVMQSNYPPPYVLHAKDRRALLLRAGQHMLERRPGENQGTKGADYWADRWNWLLHEDGASKVMTWLLRYDLTGVQFDNAVPLTAYKQELTGGGGDTIQQFAEAFGANPLGMLRRAIDGVEGVDGGELVNWARSALPLPLCFDLDVAAALYGALVKQIHDLVAFKQKLGLQTAAAWECSGVRVTMRRAGQTSRTKMLWGVDLEKNCVVKVDLRGAGFSNADAIGSAVRLLSLLDVGRLD